MIFGEEAFRRMIAIERKRTERSGHPFLLMLLEVDNHPGSVKNAGTLDGILSALQLFTRDTDVLGWYKDRTTMGAIFTGLESRDKNLVLGAILTRVSNALRDNLTREQFDRVSISFHFFPDDWDGDVPHQSIDSALYSDFIHPSQSECGRKRLPSTSL